MIAVQCWDDGVQNDLKLADILRKYKAKACFNIDVGRHLRDCRRLLAEHNGQPIISLSMNEIKSLSVDFELASHSVTHPHLTTCSAERLKYELDSSKKMLEELSGREIRGFAYPFGEYNEETVEALRVSGYKYARTVKNASPSYPPRDPLEFHPNCHFLSRNFMEEFSKAVERNELFWFWGHSYEIESPEQWQDIENKIKMISEHPSAEWKFPSELFI